MPWTMLMGSTGLVALVLAVLRTSTSVSLGDAPEFTTVVRAVGIAHAPGYPTYVLLARLFTLLEPFGSIAWRVALFSGVCSAVAAALLVAVGRRLGFGPVASVGMALIAATGLSWWWNAGFAKPYALTELLLVGLLLAGLVWRERPGLAAPLGGGVLLGLASGASYQPVLLAVPALVLMVFTGSRRPTLREVLLCVAPAGVLTLGLLGYELVRAASHPALNWGNPSSVAALARLVRMTDFHFGARSALSGSAAGGAAVVVHHQSKLLRAMEGVPLWPVEVIGELSVVALALAVGGFVVWVRGHSIRRFVFVPALVVIQAVGLAIAVNMRPNPYVGSVAAFGAFWAPATLAALIWIGLALDALERAGKNNEDDRRRRRQRKRDQPEGVWLGWLAPAAVLVAVVPAAVGHWWVADHGPPIADAYGRNTLAALPQKAVLAVDGAEFGAPLQYRQLLFHERRDVDLVYVDLLDRPWYRTQVATKLKIAPFPQMSGYKFLLLAGKAVPNRPLYVDGATAAQLGTAIGLEMHGFAWAVKADSKQQTVDVADTERLFGTYAFPALGSYRARHWPNLSIQTEFAYSMFRYGLALASNSRNADANDALHRALAWEPGNAGIQTAIARLQQGQLGSTQPATSSPAATGATTTSSTP